MGGNRAELNPEIVRVDYIHYNNYVKYYLYYDENHRTDTEIYVPKDPKKFLRLIPISEILSNIYGKGIATKTIWAKYNEIMKLGSEMNVLMEVPADKLTEVAGETVAKAILNNREGKITIQPGYDGEYGVPLMNGENIQEMQDSEIKEAPKKQKRV